MQSAVEPSTPKQSPTPIHPGGKAATLRALESAGFRVPAFVCSPVDVEAAICHLGFPLVVRSSASVEDGREVSFAGQFKSFLDLRTPAEVGDAIRRCRESLRAESVVEYCRRNGIDPRSLRMDVIVQRMIEPDLSGVAFTVDPVNGAEEVVIEACEGLSDELLAGHRTALPRSHPLLEMHAVAIEKTALAIQRHFGAPQDVEFAIASGELFVLQSRPITRIGFAHGMGEWTNADFRDGGVSCGVCTPLMWSLYDFIWEDTLKGFLREIKVLDGDFQAGRMFFGRPYWNLGEVKRCLAKLPGFIERKFDEDLGIAPGYEGDGLRTPITPWRILKALPTVFAIESMWKQQERFDRAFLAGGFDTLARRYEEIPGDVETALSGLIHDAYRITESNYFRTIYCASLAKMDFMDAFPGADYAALAAGLPALKHLEPVNVMRDMAARGESDLSGVLERFRHRSRRELDISAPRWDEDREWVAALLRAPVDAARRDPRRIHEEARAAAFAALPRRKHRQFERKLERLRTFVWLREEMRDLSSRMYYLIRRHVLEIARRRDLGDDIFFMSFPEILADDRSQIARNRATHESYRNFKAPNEIGSRFEFSAKTPESALTGIGASHGTARGIAHVARSVEEAMQAARGAILVCPFTDPGWTPVLGRVAGVITETGGLLSHAAVICREYGIPAVLAVPGATYRIPHGSRIAVHGFEGFAELLDESDKGVPTNRNPNPATLAQP